jgi:hypothetical protein
MPNTVVLLFMIMLMAIDILGIRYTLSLRSRMIFLPHWIIATSAIIFLFTQIDAAAIAAAAENEILVAIGELVK